MLKKQQRVKIGVKRMLIPFVPILSQISHTLHTLWNLTYYPLPSWDWIFECDDRGFHLAFCPLAAPASLMHMLTNVCNNFSWPNEMILHILFPIIICVALHNSILPIMGCCWRAFEEEKNWKNYSQFLRDEKLPRLMIAYFFLLRTQSVISQHFLSCALFLLLSLALALSNGKRTFGIFQCFLLRSFLFSSLQRIIVWDRYIIGL